jgi:hypothetical protein
MTLLLALAEGWDLLGGKRGRGATGSKAQLPFADPPQATPRLLQEYRRSLFNERRPTQEDWHGDVYAAQRAARLISIAAQADQRGWKVDRKKDRKEIEQWLEKAVVNPAMNADCRVAVAAYLAELDERRMAGVEAAWASWRSSSPGARALLATCIEDTRPEDAVMLLASAVGYARWSPDSMLASYPPVEMGRANSWQFSDDKNAAEVLRAVARQDPRHPVARALANGLILELAASGWQSGGRELEDAVSAIVDYAAALSAAAGPGSLENIAYVKPGILHLERTISKGRSMPVANALGSARATDVPDTVRCAVGDTLLVLLLPTGPSLLYPAALRDPMPSGATHVEHTASRPYYFASPTVRDNHVQMSAYLHPGQPALEHRLVADRSGTFYVPPAKLFLEHLPSIQTESGAFVLEIRP